MMAARMDPADQLAHLKRRLANEKHLLDKLKMIRALHMASYNMTCPVDKMAVEFYYAIGDVLEGTKPEDLNLKVINKDAFLKELIDV
jgi:hypothetical protein